MTLVGWILVALHAYCGLHNLLNALHVLHTAKYAQGTTIALALAFPALAGAGAYLLLVVGDPRLAVMAGLGPWVLGALVMAVTLATGSWQ